MFVLGAALLLVVLIVLEGKRQERRYGRGSGKGASLARTGMLDLQRHLQPDRKVEIHSRKSAKTDHATSGDPSVPGER